MPDPIISSRGMKSLTGSMKGGGRGASGYLTNEDSGLLFPTIAAFAELASFGGDRLHGCHA